MSTAWFCLVAFLLVGYTVLDGYDIGSGLLHLFVARSDEERRIVLRTIGPVWDGNEVWLIALGGTLFFAFPIFYASAFSGFYLEFMVLLWILIGRGISLEFRSHFSMRLWPQFWDIVFAAYSFMLAFSLGVALGNVVRGVPIGENGYFFLPLWTNGLVSGPTAIFDWYTFVLGLTSTLVFALEGSLWLTMRTKSPIRERARLLGYLLWPPVGFFTALVTFFSFYVQPIVAEHMTARPWGFVFPALGFVSYVATLGFHFGRMERLAFTAFSGFVFFMLATVAVSLFPYLLPPVAGTTRGLDVYTTSTTPYGMTVGFVWWGIGIALMLGYMYFAHRTFAGRVTLDEDGY